MSDRKHIYLDNGASTRTAPEVVEAMQPYFDETYAVASSQFSHTPGILAREGLDNARKIIADKLKAENPDEIVFTSGGTEANNLALKGLAWAETGKKRVICSKIEHNSVLHSAQWLAKKGLIEIVTLDVDGEGFVDLNQLEDLVTDQTLLVSLQHANHEVGTIQAIEAAAQICKKKDVLFHTDAQFSFGWLDIDLSKTPVDLLTVSAHRIHGPKGMGALYIRKGAALEKMLHGGYHENNFRSGTENVAGAVGFGKAVEIITPNQISTMKELQQKLIEQIKADIPGIRINGPEDLSRRVPNNVNITFDLVEGESVVLHLDMRGIAVITGSACFSRSLEPSYVMMAMGFTHERAHGSIRFSLSRYNTPEEIDQVVRDCKEVVESLRKISPLTR